jgi:hypothetical protein
MLNIDVPLLMFYRQKTKDKINIAFLMGVQYLLYSKFSSVIYGISLNSIILWHLFSMTLIFRGTLNLFIYY